MAILKDAVVKLSMTELDNRSDILCKNIKCRHNLYKLNDGGLFCNLKFVSIGGDGACEDFSTKEIKAENGLP